MVQLDDKGRNDSKEETCNDDKECLESRDKLKDRPIRRKRQLCDGIYIKGKIQDTPVIFTVDTGACRTVLATKVYQSLPEGKRPVLKQSSCLTGAGGIPLNELGKGYIEMSLGSYHLKHEVVVADIEDECLLGIDILQNGPFGPADLLLKKGILLLDGHEVPCSQIGMQETLRKVVAADDVEIPGLSEAVIDVYVERTDIDDDSRHSNFLIEPTENFDEAYPLKLAATLVDINEAVTCKVRLINPFSKPVAVRQDTVIGKAERIVENPTVLINRETGDNGNGNNCIRRIQLKTDTPKIRRVGSSNGTTRNSIPDHLQDLYAKASGGRSPREQEVLAELLNRYQGVFSKNDWDIGLTNVAEHSINTGDAAPIKQKPHRVPMAYAPEEKKVIDDLLSKGVIKKSTSPWASPIVLVKKKSGALRPCVDYRKVNELVKPDGFPMPVVRDCLDAVAGARLFSTFDMTSGYFQIPLKKEDIPKSAFVCKYGQFEMTRMPFGLNSAASTFQRVMEIVLQGLQWETCLIYIDDVIVYGSSFDEHIGRVEQVLQRLQDAGLKINPRKCELLQTEVVFLGHLVSGEGVKPNPTNIEKILSWPQPKTPKQAKQFVAMGSYYRRFIRNFAQKARPLIELTKKSSTFVWTDSCEKAFNIIKEELIGPEIMGYPQNDGGMFILDVDACDKGIGGVLMQLQEGRERVIAYASRALNKAESNYCITEKELLAVRYFVEYFRQYLLGRRFKVRSDHQALVWLFKLKEPRAKVARWIEILSQYDFMIEYRPGTKQGHCDALSRCETPKDCHCAEVDMSEPLKCGPCKKCMRRAEIMILEWEPKRDAEDVSASNQCSNGEECSIEGFTSDMSNEKMANKPCPVIGKADVMSSETPETNDKGEKIRKTRASVPAWNKDMREAQMNDPNIGQILMAKEIDVRPSKESVEITAPELRHYWILWDDLSVEDGVLSKIFKKEDGTGVYRQIIVPLSRRNSVMHQLHDTLLSGHMGARKTRQKILQRYYWYNLREDVNIYVRQCDVCAATKKPYKMPKAPMGHLRTGAPWDMVATDFIGPFPVTPRGNRYIMVLTDHFTKYVEVIPTPDQSAEVCAAKVVNEFIARWGCPLSIHSDQGRNFESKIYQEMCQLLDIRKSRTSPRNPRGNGQTERFNRTLIKMIKAYLCGEQNNWDLNLGCLAGAYRATPSEATSLTPNMMTMGREVRLPTELVHGAVDKKREPVPVGKYVGEIRDRMMKAHEIARKHLKSAAKRSKDLYDVKATTNKYKRGDVVWCLKENRTEGVSPKLENTYDGPYLVTKRLSEQNYVVQFAEAGREKVLHHNKLKPYEGTNIPRWIKRSTAFKFKDESRL